jgi:hypothetical protein
MRRQNQKPVVGFFKDRDGKTKPITKSTAELNRKRIVANPRQFRGVSPQQQEQRRQQQLAKIDQNLQQYNVLDQKLESHIKNQSETLEAQRKEFQQLQQTDPGKALRVAQSMKKNEFVLVAMTKKRARIQQKTQELQQLRQKP